MVLIENLNAYEILDSRGIPTVEVSLLLSNGLKVKASSPTGTSRGRYEACEIRDKNFSRYFGQGVTRAVKNIREVIANNLLKLDPLQQFKIDRLLVELDGTPNKARLGTNATLPVSIAVAKAASLARNIPFYAYVSELLVKIEAKDRYGDAIDLQFGKEFPYPIPLFNLINGGRHADNLINIQEYLVCPVGISSAAEQIRAAVEINWKLKEILRKFDLSTGLGEEGGFAPQLQSEEEGFGLLVRAVNESEYKLGEEIKFGLDVGASQFFLSGKYSLPKENIDPGTSDDLSSFYEKLIEKYPLGFLEDPFAEDDWEAWKKFHQKFLDKVLLVGDDLTVTNSSRLFKATEEKTISGIVIKPNQIGTITETLRVVKQAKHEGLKIVASHRSGETNDSFITDFAVGIHADFLKAGAPARGERVAKYNRLMEIARELPNP